MSRSPRYSQLLGEEQFSVFTAAPLKPRATASTRKRLTPYREPQLLVNMMQNGALRAIYGAAPKPKNVATVSPVFDGDGGLGYDVENPLGDTGSDEEDEDTSGDNPAAQSPPHRVNEEYDKELTLHTKSSVLAPQASTSFSSRFFSGRGSSNQDTERNLVRSSSTTADKYAVLGQKTEWRRTRSRSKRHGGSHATTIKHVTAEEADGNGEAREELGERASSYLSSAAQLDGIPGLATGRMGVVNSSRESSRAESSRFSSGRRSDETSSSTASDQELFVITRQKKSKFAAKLYLPGQNPLYLGRFKSEDAARAVCESAFTTITTPRK